MAENSDNTAQPANHDRCPDCGAAIGGGRAERQALFDMKGSRRADWLYRYKKKIILSILAIMIAAIILTMGVIAATLRSRLIEDSKSKTAELSDIIGSSLGHLMLVRNAESIQDTLEIIGKSGSSIVRVLILDKNGKVAYGMPKSGIGTLIDRFREPSCRGCHSAPGALPHQTTMILKVEGQDVLRNVKMIQNEKACHQCHPASDTINGKLIIDRSMRSTYSLIVNIELILALMGGLCLLVLVPLSSRRLSRGMDKYIHEILCEIAGHVKAEQEIATSLRLQSMMSEVLRVSLEPIPLEEQLQRILNYFFSIPWLSLQSKGSIFLLDRGSQVLRMTAQRGLPEALLTSCREVPIGYCLCGRVAGTGEIVYAQGLDDRHDMRYPGMLPHGHYCIPILSDGRIYGVINLYVQEGHVRRTEDENFLSSVARVLAGIINRKEAEEALRQSEERFDLAVRGTDAGIWDWDLANNKVYYSPRWKSMLGYSDEEIRGHYIEWEKRVHPEDIARALATIQNYLEGLSEDYELSHRLRHKDGSYRWVLARGVAVREHNGKPYRMVGSHIDVTELRRAEEALQENEFQLLAARRIQEHLLPARPPDVPGFDIAGASYPAEMAGGDSFDYLRMEDGSICISIGDVTGHGFASALLMASTLAHLRSISLIHSDPGQILALANAALYAETEANRFVTLLLGHLDPRTRSFSYSSAGHPTCYVLDTSGEIKVQLESTALPLGLMPRTVFPVVGPVALDPGDIVLLLTDGILEAQSPGDDYFGIERALETVRMNCNKTAHEIVECLCRAVFEFSRSENPSDDVTVVVIQVAGE